MYKCKLVNKYNKKVTLALCAILRCHCPMILVWKELLESFARKVCKFQELCIAFIVTNKATTDISHIIFRFSSVESNLCCRFLNLPRLQDFLLEDRFTV